MLNPLSEVLWADVMLDILGRREVLDNLFLELGWSEDFNPARYESSLSPRAREGIRISQATKLSLIRSCHGA